MKRITERLTDWTQGHPLALPAMEQIHVTLRGRRVVFCVNMAEDPIQNAHRRGRFYEAAELDALRALLPKAPVVLDVGANVGNHALYFALIAGAAKVVVVEPNPLAIGPLVGNVLLNRLEGVIDLSHLGFGLSDRSAGGYHMKVHDKNLGATRMQPTGGSLEVRRGDEAFPDLVPDLLKIDVEGMEMEVLRGLEALIARARPLMMVEVGKDHQFDMAIWVAEHGYATHSVTSVGPKNDNHILIPVERAGAADQT